MRRVRIQPGPATKDAAALELMMIARTWRPSSRKGVASAGQICFSDTIWPGGPEHYIFQQVINMIPGAIMLERDILEPPEVGIGFHAIQVNKYDPIQWKAPLAHSDNGNAGISWMIVLGEFEGGAFYVQERPPPAKPTKITQCNKWITFDGLRKHWADPIRAGVRYSVIAFRFAELP